MPSRPIPFIIDEAGERWYCAKWKSERDRNLALTGGYLDFAPPLEGRALHQETPAADAEADDPRGRGRPRSYDASIAAAVAALGGGRPMVHAIQKHIAASTADLPSRQTVTRWLDQNCVQKSVQESECAKVRSRNKRRPAA